MINKTHLIVFVYMTAIVIANISVTYFGPIGLWVTGFILIPFDLFSRDILHEEWKRDKLFLRMFTLIVCGGVLSAIINHESYVIAVASCTAFLVAGISDSIVYKLLEQKKTAIKMNVSNIFSSFFDSWIFISIAFGLDMNLVFIQTGIKFFGSLLWTTLYILIYKRK